MKRATVLLLFLAIQFFGLAALFFGGFNFAHAAIVFDSAESAGSALDANSLTFAHTVSGANPILIVDTGTNNSSAYEFEPNAVTYNGVSLTKVTATSTQPIGFGHGGWGDMWYLLNPPTGAHNVIVTCASCGNNGGGWYISAAAVSYDGASASQTNIIAKSTVAAIYAQQATSTVALDAGALMLGMDMSDRSASFFLPNASTTQRAVITSNGASVMAVETTSTVIGVNFNGTYAANVFIATEIVPSISPQSVGFSAPSNGVTFPSDFANWVLNTSNLTATGSSWIAGVDYGSLNGPSQDEVTIDGASSTIASISIPKTQPLQSPLTTDTWLASAFLENCTGLDGGGTCGIIATSTSISFSISPSQNGNSTTTPTGTSTPVITCDPNSGFFQNSFCNLFVTLLVPSVSSTQQFGNLESNLANKPPFGYSVYLNALQSIGTSTATSTLLTASTTAAFSGFFSPLDAGLGAIVWILLAFWAFHRVRHIEL